MLHIPLKRTRFIDSFELSHEFAGCLIELLIDTHTDKIYHIDGNVGHLHTVAKVLNVDPTQLTLDNAGHLVPAVIEMQGNTIKGFVVGRSSLESSVKHTEVQLAIAKLLVERLISFSMQIDHKLHR